MYSDSLSDLIDYHQSTNPVGQEECIIQYQGGRCRMTRAQMATANADFEFQEILPSGKPLFKAVQPSSSGRSMTKTASRSKQKEESIFGAGLQYMYNAQVLRNRL